MMPTARCVLPTPTEPTNSRPVLSIGYSSTKRPARKRASRMLFWSLSSGSYWKLASSQCSVARRDVRRRQQALAAVLHAAFAAHRLALFAAFDGLPSGAAADGAGLGRCGHEFESTAGQSAAQLGTGADLHRFQRKVEESVGICGNRGAKPGDRVEHAFRRARQTVTS